MSIGRRKRVAVCHPRMGQGGSEVTAMYAIQALAPDHEVDLLTTGRVDLDALNEWCATSVAREDVRVRSGRLPFPLSRISGGDALRGAVHTRHCRALAPAYDVMISAYNVCDFGLPGIHLLADFSWDEAYRGVSTPLAGAGLRAAFRKEGLLRAIYRRFVARVAPPSGRDLFGGEDLIVSNSHWSADRILAGFGLETEVLYPPVPFVQNRRPWTDRKNRVVTIGRLSPEKNIERMVEIMHGVRERGHEMGLHVAGPIDSPYARRLVRTCEAEAPWVRFVGPLSGASKRAFLEESRFGLHACGREAFGIAVAEMALAGCVVLVPEDGGQAEIVRDTALHYDSVAQGVEKFVALLESESRLAGVRTNLRSGLVRFTNQDFSREVREMTSKFLSGSGSAGENRSVSVAGP